MSEGEKKLLKLRKQKEREARLLKQTQICEELEQVVKEAATRLAKERDEVLENRQILGSSKHHKQCGTYDRKIVLDTFGQILGVDDSEAEGSHDRKRGRRIWRRPRQRRGLWLPSK